ncbi:glycosyl transferase [Mycolicibacterium madagascariense]|uniref:Glycosyl transferase n=1 Tax=Mycolicibacterium madagascariense TaxID=212765 RepID=A0A7I7XAE9_9MYCO|nr:glycosyltransferase family 4 protein [Mycolicibacterium madagascariense]MCV7011369.1 glycosyltransferase family 4 protein [Mycolicibacterium madagascariense]BBZ26749.1 glycosyl transferase [Mycolicibacterium madagascariense]
MSERVLIVSHYFPPHLGGIENVAREEARHLARAGFDVTVVTTAIGEPAGRRRLDGYTVARVRAWNGIEGRTGVPFPIVGPSSIKTFVELIRSADVVHVHDTLYLTSWLAGLGCLLLRKPLVLTHHVGLIDHPNKFVVAVQRAVYATAGRALIRTARRIIYFNSRVLCFLRGLGATDEQVAFIPNGVDTEVFHPANVALKRRLRQEMGLPANAVLVLFAGRFVPKKGYDILLQCHSPLYRMLLAGGEPSAGDRAGTNAVFLGLRSQAELADLYRAADIFVLPSSSEGFPLTVQEAMASRLAVVTSDDPGYDVFELDPTRVALVPPNVDSVRAALEAIASDEATLSRMAAYSYQVASERFSWPTHVDALAGIYRGLVRQLV